MEEANVTHDSIDSEGSFASSVQNAPIQNQTVLWMI